MKGAINKKGANMKMTADRENRKKHVVQTLPSVGQGLEEDFADTEFQTSF